MLQNIFISQRGLRAHQQRHVRGNRLASVDARKASLAGGASERVHRGGEADQPYELAISLEYPVM